MLAASEICRLFMAQVVTQLIRLWTSWSDAEPLEGKLLWERLVVTLFQKMLWKFEGSKALLLQMSIVRKK